MASDTGRKRPGRKPFYAGGRMRPLGVSMTDALRARLTAVATERGKTPSTLAREYIERGVKAAEKARLEESE